MATIRIEVWWNHTSRETIDLDLDQKVCDVIELIRRQVGAPLPEEDKHGHPVEYALYKNEQGHWVALMRRTPLRRAGIGQRDQMYLANRKARWWDGDSPWPPVPAPPDERGSSQASPPDCQLRLAAHCMIKVPPDGISLDRKYLLDALPGLVVARENVKGLIGGHSPLMRVSREKHCKLFRTSTGWTLRAYRPTYVGGKLLQEGSSILLTESTTIMLGKDGWTVEVLFDARTE